MAIVDVNTGKPAKTSQDASNFQQSQVSGPKTTGTVTQGTQAQSGTSTVSGTQNTANRSYAMNTTPTILAALENFITQMSDRPAISNAELEATYPDAVLESFGAATAGGFGSGGSGFNAGNYYVNPVTGMRMSHGEAQQFNDQQAAKRELAKQQSGVIKGGTEQQRAISDARLEEIQRNRQTQGKYTKEAAQADAQNLSSYFSRILSEQQMPGILRGAEGSGTSKGTTRALLTEQAIQRTAEVAAKTGLDASVAYGNINNQLANTLEALTRQDPNSTENQLLQALGIGKGIVQDQASSQSTNTNQTTNTQQNTTTNQNQVAVESGQAINTIRQDLDTLAPMSNTGQPAPYKDTYQGGGGSGYVVANPDTPAYANVGFVDNSGGGDSGGGYSDDDSNYIF